MRGVGGAHKHRPCALSLRGPATPLRPGRQRNCSSHPSRRSERRVSTGLCNRSSHVHARCKPSLTGDREVLDDSRGSSATNWRRHRLAQDQQQHHRWHPCPRGHLDSLVGRSLGVAAPSWVDEAEPDFLPPSALFWASRGCDECSVSCACQAVHGWHGSSIEGTGHQAALRPRAIHETNMPRAKTGQATAPRCSHRICSGRRPDLRRTYAAKAV